jgi:DNA-binding XRE family transcriptional regulator
VVNVFNNKVLIKRKEIGMSCTELARRSGISRVALQRIEKGNDTRVSIALAIAKALRTDLNEIFFVVDGKQVLQHLKSK